MDPNANLRRQRVLATLILHDNLPDADYAGAVEELADLVLALDAWLARAGALPEVWSR